MQTYKHTNTQTYKHTNIQTYKHTNTQTYKLTNIETYKHVNIQAWLQFGVTSVHKRCCPFPRPDFGVTTYGGDFIWGTPLNPGGLGRDPEVTALCSDFNSMATCSEVCFKRTNIQTYDTCAWTPNKVFIQWLLCHLLCSLCFPTIGVSLG